MIFKKKISDLSINPPVNCNSCAVFLLGVNTKFLSFFLSSSKFYNYNLQLNAAK